VARRPLPAHPKLLHTCCDLRDPAARAALAGVDVLWHLGFSLWRERTGIAGLARMAWPVGAAARTPEGDGSRPGPDVGGSAPASGVNQLGTENVLAAGPGRIVFASSASVYGAWPDNPLPLAEDRQPRPNPECRYANDKLACDQRCLDAGVPAVVLRIGAVLGPHADPRVGGAVSGYRRIVPGVAGTTEALQFLDEEDAADALHLAGKSDAEGILNIAPVDWLTASEVAAVAQSRVVRVPLPLLLGGSEVAFRLGLLPFGSDRAILLNGPLALDSSRAAAALGWRARLTSADVLRAALAPPDRGAPGRRAEGGC
jgi:nucleoside-diphosphate-sugar epimerase